MAAAGSVSTHSIYPKLDLSLLAEEPFILHFPEQTTGQLSLEALKAAHIKPYVPIQSRNTETCVKLCMQGLGMCFTPETYVQNMDLPVKPACFSIGEDGVFQHTDNCVPKRYLSSTVRPGFYMYCEECPVGF